MGYLNKFGMFTYGDGYGMVNFKFGLVCTARRMVCEGVRHGMCNK